ncbi:MAG: DedA family protein [Flavobacteriia bacterium]|jgi:membrane protein YqaA with SNARE-associated domain|nr:DedA family protein [Flavobacteriia bacterium]
MEYYLEWGYLGLFLASFLAATVLPLSSEIVLSFLLANEYDFLSCLTIATLGNWLGGLSSYGLGYLANWKIIERFLGHKHHKIQAIKTHIEKWGSLLALSCWLPIIGDLFAVGLGFFRVSFFKVALWMGVGKGFRYAVWGAFFLWGFSLL